MTDENAFWTVLWLNKPARRTLVLATHVALWTGAFVLAIALRLDGAARPQFGPAATYALVALLAFRIAAFAVAGLFRGLWRYAGFPELEKIVVATTLSSVAAILLDAAVSALHVPPSVYLVEWLASIVFTGGARLAMRSVVERRHRRRGGRRTLIIGAGDAGESLVRDVQGMVAGERLMAVGFLDDDPLKQDASIRGVPVLGGADDLSIERHIRDFSIQLVVLAMPTAPGQRIRQIVRVCQRLGVEVRTVPALVTRVPGRDWADEVRKINIDDLLRRDAIQLDVANIAELVRRRVVLVTGAGGSIGSELSRQLLQFAPKLLLLLDHDENALFHIERELRETFPQATIEALIADITDNGRIEGIFADYRPSLVLHAAAHKHVAMMESNPCEAVKNNVLGTITLAQSAHTHGAGAFVLISSDKAVRPTSVMGATKRVTEMVIQQFACTSLTRFVAVRFGNVLGSAGSVIPIFKEQIARGGPVTVTHPDVCRYFMTIPEASLLVLEAATLGNTGEILMLDMGKPIKIVELARDLIELSGVRPDRDVEIVYTGLKPGEKLAEELLLETEAYDRTQHPKIVVGRIEPIEPPVLDRALDVLRRAAEAQDERAVRHCLSALIPDANLIMPPDDAGGVLEVEPEVKLRHSRTG